MLYQDEGDRFKQLVQERDKRQVEMLRLFRPLPYQVPIFTSKAPDLIVRGGNRSGKTTSASVLFASLAMGKPIIGPDDKPLPSPWPKHWPKDGGLLLWCVGYDEKHVGQTIFRHLFMPGLFRVIKDPVTGKYRTYQPWRTEDQALASETISSEPLIPDRYIKHWSWKDKARHIFESVELINGTVIRAYSSRGEVKQGDKVHCIWIDEDIEYESHIGEFHMRLLDHRGRLIWSAFPHSKNQALIELSEQADEQRDWDNPLVEEIKVNLLDNPYIGADQKARAEISLTSDEEKRARIFGEFVYDSFLVYPSFNKRVHCGPGDDDQHWDHIDEVFKNNERPADWCRYLAIDPGYTRCAVVFAAVPPPDLFDQLRPEENYVVIEGELYEKGKTVDEIAALIRNWTERYPYEAFLIDWHAARQTPMSGGDSIYVQFRKAFEKYRIYSNQTHSGFIRGNDDINGRIEIVRQYLSFNRLGRPRLRLFGDKTPNMQKEFMRYKFRQTPQGFIDEIPVKRHDHLMDALGYLLSIHPDWKEPEHAVMSEGGVYRAFQAMQERTRKKLHQGNRFVSLGPAG